MEEQGRKQKRNGRLTKLNQGKSQGINTSDMTFKISYYNI